MVLLQQSDYRIRIDDAFFEGEYDARVLPDDSPTAYNTVEEPERVIPKALKL